ncbi:MAG: T9SS type A sorting domain-containing protein [Chitinophagaceae bacterium]
MKKIILLFTILSSLINSGINGQSSSGTLDVVSWNLEWFGSPSNGPSDDNLQEANAKKILRFLDADLYGMVEIVDTMRFRRLVDSLGNTEFGYIIAPYCTQATAPTGNAWLNGQKQAFIYRKSVFSNVTTRGLMRSSATANTNFASGRFPFMISATVTINSISKNMNFIVLHAKAGSTAEDYNKRIGGAQELKDTLDAQFSTTNNYIIGDFNDALNSSIYLGASVSSYDPIVKDSTDTDRYKSITLPLGASGQTSMINFPNVIDNHVISNEVEPFYIPGSAKIRTDITSVVPDYITAHNTSDHYPVFSRYSLDGVVTGITSVSANELGIQVSPNPFSQTINITATKTLNNIQFRLININGQIVSSQTLGIITAGGTVQPVFSNISSGIYFLQVETKQFRTVVKLIHL